MINNNVRKELEYHSCNTLECCSIYKVYYKLFGFIDNNSSVQRNLEREYWVLDDTEYEHEIIYCPYCGKKLE